MTEQQTTWTFLTNHSHVLYVISKTSDIRVREISSLVGITERAVLRIIQELADAAFVVIEKVGRENRYSVTSDVPLRHQLEQHRTVSELLEMLAEDEDDDSPQD
jgi:predicted transcriptional regulator